MIKGCSMIETHRIFGKLNRTRSLRRPNQYTTALLEDLNDHSFDEERAPLYKGFWRPIVFNTSDEAPLDLEIGTGNGTFFSRHASEHPDRKFLGVEIKYKPLIQTIRGALRQKSVNAKVIRYHALALENIFESHEINDVYVHFPDPWVSPRKPQNRVMQSTVLNKIFDLQRPNSFLRFKTDNYEYFRFALDEIKSTPYRITELTEDLHNSEFSKNNFVTQFENIFSRQGIKINHVKLHKS
jgi:tRNA (guanine-N7-)-methyltransferase